MFVILKGTFQAEGKSRTALQGENNAILLSKSEAIRSQGEALLYQIKKYFSSFLLHLFIPVVCLCVCIKHVSMEVI